MFGGADGSKVLASGSRYVVSSSRPYPSGVLYMVYWGNSDPVRSASM